MHLLIGCLKIVSLEKPQAFPTKTMTIIFLVPYFEPYHIIYFIVAEHLNEPIKTDLY